MANYKDTCRVLIDYVNKYKNDGNFMFNGKPIYDFFLGFYGHRIEFLFENIYTRKMGGYYLVLEKKSENVVSCVHFSNESAVQSLLVKGVDCFYVFKKYYKAEYYSFYTLNSDYKITQSAEGVKNNGGNLESLEHIISGMNRILGTSVDANSPGDLDVFFRNYLVVISRDISFCETLLLENVLYIHKDPTIAGIAMIDIPIETAV